MENDTLWVTINSKWTKHGPLAYWVRFPKDEKGQFDHKWTPENSDSLGWAIVYDWHRRRYKYFATLAGRPEAYDSTVKAGSWDWSMKDEHIQEALERKRKREP